MKFPTRLTSLLLSLLAAAPTTKPVDPEAAAFLASIKAVEAAVPKVGVLRDPAERAKLAPTVVPVLKNFLTLEHERIVKVPRTAGFMGSVEAKSRAILTVLGEPADLPGVPDNHPDEERQSAEYLLADHARQAEMVNDVTAKLKANPDDAKSAFLCLVMHSMGDAATPELNAQLKGAVTTMLAIRRAKIPASAAKTQALVDHPLVLAGTDPEGKPFTTSAWAGKVVLVDFWATWCGPCKAGLPHVKEIYAKYHDQGLEIVGVSNDITGAALTKFLKADPAMPWPQLFDPTAGAAHKWHPLTTQFGVDTIPRMFLIDRRGVCRSITARQEMDKLIPALLAEPSPATQPTASAMP